VYRDGDILGEVDAPPYTDSTVSPGPYRYRVASLGDNASESDLSLPATVEVPEPVDLDLEVSHIPPFGRRAIQISIASDPCLDTVRISWREEDSSDSPTVETLAPTGCVDTFVHAISGLRPNTEYRINVTAIGTDGGSGSTTAVFSTTRG